ncbi:MAG: hypothetical protein SFY81_10760 [Verrucomicrobiota bacterium]|nr:hypothetical protein [Verrucomicrobiota bacterium]
MQTDRTEGMTIGTSASMLGVHEFSLLARIQKGEIETKRARSGEMLIPPDRLEKLLPDGSDTRFDNTRHTPSDQSLGIEKTKGGLKRNGIHPEQFVVPDHAVRLGEKEIESYRAAFGAIAREIELAGRLKFQLNDPANISSFAENELATQQGRWRVHSTLLNLGQSDVLLCERGFKDFAVVERFRENTPFARAHGQIQVLLEGNNPAALTNEFKGNARHTLEFMVSNAVAKAQKVAWEQFPEHRPGHVMAAISDRCRKAVANAETISESQKMNQAVNRGVRM